jgi:type IV secretory pathway VirB9-like protein
LGRAATPEAEEEDMSFDYPKDAATRRELREKHYMRNAKQALHTGQSIRCAAGDHRRRFADGDDTGCRNDGSNCLCWCHDQESAT